MAGHMCKTDAGNSCGQCRLMDTVSTLSSCVGLYMWSVDWLMSWAWRALARALHGPRLAVDHVQASGFVGTLDVGEHDPAFVGKREDIAWGEEQLRLRLVARQPRVDVEDARRPQRSLIMGGHRRLPQRHRA
eukprot:4211012-Prymnesium_polylepis.2